LNEDTVKTEDIWSQVHAGKFRIVYVSPEMALSPSFKKLWLSNPFRERVVAVVVDEAHCIEEWGADFRPCYQQLATVRSFVGHGIPFVEFGHRAMWGIDVGCARKELSYVIKPLAEQVTPAKQIWDQR